MGRVGDLVERLRSAEKELQLQRYAADLRETFELDSLDFVELVEKLSARAGFRIEDSDADALRTPQSATAFLVRGRRDAGS